MYIEKDEKFTSDKEDDSCHICGSSENDGMFCCAHTKNIQASANDFVCEHCGVAWEDQLSKMTCPCLDMDIVW